MGSRFARRREVRGDEARLCGLQADPSATRQHAAGEAQGQAGEPPGQPASGWRWGHALPALAWVPEGSGTAPPPPPRRAPPPATWQAEDSSREAQPQPRDGSHHSQEIRFSRAAPRRKFMAFSFFLPFCQTLLLLFRIFSLTHGTIFPFRKRTQIPKSQCSRVLLTV